MGHYGNCHELYKVKFRPGYPQTDFAHWWQKQTPCRRDGCTCCPSVRVLNDGNYTKAAASKYEKTYRDKWDGTKTTEVKDRFMELPGSYNCHAVLVGIVGWRAVRKVRKVVNHHITEVEETKDYKSRPKTPLKGSTLYALGRFYVSYDARDYDPVEHGDVPQDDDEW